MELTHADAILAQWYDKSKLDRWLLPRDFLNEVQLGDTVDESTCTKYTTKSLAMSERETIKTLKLKDQMKYTTPLGYVPTGFKNETVHIMLNGAAVNCSVCSGRGMIDCPPEVPCQRCEGKARVQEVCRDCKGSGQVKVFRAAIDDYQTVRCNRSGCRNGIYQGDCPRCLSPHGTRHGSTGMVQCSRCNGVGELPCRACASEGQVIRAKILTRKFSHSTNVVFNSDGLDRNKFRNGIKRYHFWRLKGNLLSDDIEEYPDHAGVVRRQETVEVFDIRTATFTYKGKPFTVSSIMGEKEKFVTAKAPFAKKKLAAFYATSAVVGIAALGALLAIAAVV